MSNETLEVAVLEPCVGESLAFCGLDTAIANTAIATRGAEGLTLLILQSHLKKLCKMQREQFTPSAIEA